jgi:cellulose synthase/poly-beta-1,6-N-acetylglucosamine synthase-like glycosyltransferase
MTTNHHFIQTRHFSPNIAVKNVIPEFLARSGPILPLYFEGEQLVIATPNPQDKAVISSAEKYIRHPVTAYLASFPDVRDGIDRLYDRPLPGPFSNWFPQILDALGYLKDKNLRNRLRLLSPDFRAIHELRLELELETELELTEAMAWYFNLPYVNLDEIVFQPGISCLIPWHLARQFSLLPLWLVGDLIYVASPYPLQRPITHQLSLELGFQMQPLLCSQKQWNRAFTATYMRGPTFEFDENTIAERLQKQGFISNTTLRGALAIQSRCDLPLGEILVEQGVITWQQWNQVVSQLSDLQFVEKPDPLPTSPSYRIPPNLARACRVLPLGKEDNTLLVAMERPDRDTLQLIESHTGLKVSPWITDPKTIDSYLNRMYGSIEGPLPLPQIHLGELLIKMGRVTTDQLEYGLGLQKTIQKRIGEILLELGSVDERSLAQALSYQTGHPFVSLNKANYKYELIQGLPKHFTEQGFLLPLLSTKEKLWVVGHDPFAFSELQEIERHVGKRVGLLIAPHSAITSGIRLYHDEALRQIDLQVFDLFTQLVTQGALTRTAATDVLNQYAHGEGAIDQLLVAALGATEEDVARLLAKVMDFPFIDTSLQEHEEERIDPLGVRIKRTIITDPVQPAIAIMISAEVAKELNALPIKMEGEFVVVAFAVPPLDPLISQVEGELGLPIRPALTTRRALLEAINRHLGRRNIGTELLLSGAINYSQLNDALELAQRSGVRIGTALVNRGYVTQHQLYEVLSKQLALPLVDLDPSKLAAETIRLIDPQAARDYGILPISANADEVTLAMVDPLDSQALEVASHSIDKALKPVLVTEESLDNTLAHFYGTEYLARSISELLERSPENSAYYIFSRGQKIFMLLSLVLSILCFVIAPLASLITINSLASIYYLAISAYKFYLVYRGLRYSREISVTAEEVAALDERLLPKYTILIPLYHEAEVLPDLIRAISELNYPPTKLDVKVLMEADDPETVEAFNKSDAPDFIRPVIVPVAQPKTKPKACNYGLMHARGKFIAIYDAEDLPEPDQLKRAVVAFSKVPPEVVCIQSRLNFYNRTQNLLTRWFTVEYSMWFDLLLPGLDAERAPIPLGGTSNHIRRDALIEIGAWDPFNVTEDADLGMRLFKAGYRTATLNSTTYEEANSQAYNWIRQRSRWIKGYIQTWLVHMRHPLKLLKEIGLRPFLSFQLIVGGTFFATIANPIYWVLTSLWFLIEFEFIRAIYPGVIFHVGAISLYLGNFAFTYMNLAGALNRQYYDLVRYALFSPLYWGLMSIGAWRGFLQLITKPHFWEKTVHNLFKGEPELVEKSTT